MDGTSARKSKIDSLEPITVSHGKPSGENLIRCYGCLTPVQFPVAGLYAECRRACRI